LPCGNSNKLPVSDFIVNRVKPGLHPCCHCG
jgi:hypothetical protein